MASSVLACLGWGRGERGYWQEGEGRSGLQNSLTTGFVVKGPIACGWYLARFHGKPGGVSQERRGRDDPRDEDSLRLWAFQQSGLGRARGGGSYLQKGLVPGLSLTKSGGKEAAGLGLAGTKRVSKVTKGGQMTTGPSLGLEP